MSQTNVPAPRGNLQRDVQARPRLATLTCPNCLGTLQVQADKNAEAPCPICRHPLKYVAPVEDGPKRFVARQRIPANPDPPQGAPPQQVAPQQAAPTQAGPPQQAPQPRIPQPQADPPQQVAPPRRQAAPQQSAPAQTGPPQQLPQARTQPRPAPAPHAPSPQTARPQAPPQPQADPATASAAPDHPLRNRLKQLDDFLNTPAGTSLAWVLLAALLTACVILFFHWDQDRRERTLRMESIESARPAASHRPSTSTVPLLPGEPAPANASKAGE